MRSFRLLAATTVILGAGACGGDNGPSENTPPVAAFTAPTCTVNAPCTFTDASTDADGAADITTRTWDFGGGVTAQGASVIHTFTAAGTPAVTLTVTDAAGASNSVTHNVTVNAGNGNNVAPTASFNLPATCVAGTPCGFQSTSSDPDDDIATATHAWTFGDGNQGSGTNATHTYATAGTYDVTLIVTDVRGAASQPVTQQLTVQPPTSSDCTTTGTQVNCVLTMNAIGRLTFTLTSRSCELSGNNLRITTPFSQTVFFNLCNQAAGSTYTIKATGGATDHVFAAGDQVTVRFEQGTPDPGDPATGDPGIQISGGAPSWTLNIDDGGAANTPGEPDFDDAVVTVQLAP
ncbi:MAG TPA: PKD domain-containing protein [Gemmatimonadales bacterium]|nr:PKD domain-containing protein [Gemmatimonadales bacterium]